MLMDAILIFDQVKRLITAVAYGDLSGGSAWRSAWDAAMARIARPARSAWMPRCRPSHRCAGGPPPRNSPATISNRSRADFEAAVEHGTRPHRSG